MHKLPFMSGNGSKEGIDLETKFDFIQKVNFCHTTLIIRYHSTVLMMNPKLQRSSFS